MLHKRLAQLEQNGTPIKVGIVGTGRMGTGVVCQISQMRGMRTVAAADVAIDRAIHTYTMNGVPREDVVVTEDPAVAADAIARGKVVATTSGQLVCQAPVDVVVEATGLPEVGARNAYDAIGARKHVVMLNVETDVVVGPILKYLADRAGVVYGVTAGDEPGVIMGLYEWAAALGFKIVCAGKGPMRPIDWNANPETLADEARRQSLNPKMLASFRDGSKHNIEMAAVANGTGLAPDVRGMHVPTVGPRELAKVFCLKSDGGILDREGVVELAAPFTDVTGATDWAHSVTPGVFVVVSTPHSQIRADLKYLVQGDGPTYAFWRPYHLCSIETPWSVARAVLYGEATLTPIGAPVVDVVTVAKKPLQPGDVLDGSGGFAVTGQIERAEVARRERLLPIGLAYGCSMTTRAERGQPITFDMVQIDPKSFVFQLRQLQDSTFGTDAMSSRG